MRQPDRVRRGRNRGPVGDPRPFHRGVAVFLVIAVVLFLQLPASAWAIPQSVSLFAPQLSASPGDTVVAVVEITAVENVAQMAAIKFAVQVDPRVLVPVCAKPRSAIAGWPADGFSYVSGTDRLSVSALTDPAVAVRLGSFVEFQFVVKDFALDGAVSPLHLTGTDDQQGIVLLESPTDLPPGLKTQGIDGSVNVVGGLSCLPGDANPDGVLNAADAVVVLRYVVGLSTDLSPEQLCAADSNRDGEINSGDAVWILRSIVGLPNKIASSSSIPRARLGQTAAGVALIVENAGAVHGIEARFDYDPVALSLDELAMPREGLRFSRAEPGELRVAWAAGRPLAAGGTLRLELPVQEILDARARLSLVHLRLFGVQGERLRAELAETSLSLGGPAQRRQAPLVLTSYPNPFNPSTTLSFELLSATRGELSIYTVSGQRVITLVDSELPSGRNEFRWNGLDGAGRPVSSGVYFARLRTLEELAQKRLILVK